ncbi:putative Fe-Mo cluster-binding NifX family protein [Mariniflexile fucanivorans]|uniref:Putative Fe-Mo cluster-binding NifX family protein n=1 Tax=Mariniflexile fucanivorans TaxID=264023 RepID=A0A4R1RPV1_9FLAO|nr:NifB/NifX family molybdenum-iron cluster-binding protein [Mariniflexile fucanivorans]TCL67922.1 putative Fe-Mo cluster-binding NifX family protein [Mariniflexile fucanivorans]
MKKIAVPITRDNQIETHFGHSQFYEIYTFSNTNEILDLQLLESKNGCFCESNIISLLAKGGVSFMLSDSMGYKAVDKLKKAGINVVRGCSGDSADVILKFIEGKISDSGISCLKHSQNHKNNLCHHSSN